MPVEPSPAPVAARPHARELSGTTRRRAWTGNSARSQAVELVTRSSIIADLRALGVEAGSTGIVHSSLTRLGWVAGGTYAVVLALRETFGPHGTIVMPAHSGDLTDPARWTSPPVPEEWWPVIRAETPAFDPQSTPTRNMGAIVDCFRTFPGVVRSMHPTVSFVALGPNADTIRATTPSATPWVNARPSPGATSSTRACFFSEWATRTTRRSTLPSRVRAIPPRTHSGSSRGHR